MSVKQCGDITFWTWITTVFRSTARVRCWKQLPKKINFTVRLWCIEESLHIDDLRFHWFCTRTMTWNHAILVCYLPYIPWVEDRSSTVQFKISGRMEFILLSLVTHWQFQNLTLVILKQTTEPSMLFRQAHITYVTH